MHNLPEFYSHWIPVKTLEGLSDLWELLTCKCQQIIHKMNKAYWALCYICE